jgi:hypothetical protein
MDKKVELSNDELYEKIKEAEVRLANTKLVSIEYLEQLAMTEQFVDKRSKSLKILKNQKKEKVTQV